MKDRIFIDSNIWIYLFVHQDNPKSKVSRQFIVENYNKNILVISYQAINEVSNVLKGKGFSETDIRFVIENMSDYCNIYDYSKDIVIFASELREKHSVSFWDSHIVASALMAQCNVLASEDMQDNQKIENLTIANPFRQEFIGMNK
ncbi:MAG: PIN domain-containing protein [Elusimicrobiota bacterium]|jgi:predicted nucleic acid-binding protein|nr:PIN domain-containing protein [Elusimicrobiota bacterium]